jgi:hypothetical protein
MSVTTILKEEERLLIEEERLLKEEERILSLTQNKTTEVNEKADVTT